MALDRVGARASSLLRASVRMVPRRRTQVLALATAGCSPRHEESTSRARCSIPIRRGAGPRWRRDRSRRSHPGTTRTGARPASRPSARADEQGRFHPLLHGPSTRVTSPPSGLETASTPGWSTLSSFSGCGSPTRPWRRRQRVCRPHGLPGAGSSRPRDQRFKGCQTRRIPR